MYCNGRILQKLEFLNEGVADRGIALTMAKGKVVSYGNRRNFIVSFSPSLARKLGLTNPSFLAREGLKLTFDLWCG